MDREIKFRGKTLANRGWQSGGLIYNRRGWNPKNELVYQIVRAGEYGTEYHKVDDKTICQFTGLKDENGLEIYEGDILLWKYDNEQQESRGMVYYRDAAFRVKIEEWKNGEPLFSYGSRYLADVFKFEGLRVIGNIHDNPDLFKTKDGYSIPTTKR